MIMEFEYATEPYFPFSTSFAIIEENFNSTILCGLSKLYAWNGWCEGNDVRVLYASSESASVQFILNA